jgi:GH15 family glucan-1,4-alpha-glucosidase
MNLWEKSVSVIRENQSSNGAFIASPAFPTYNYSWFRDGSYIAYAMDLTGEHDSAHRFFNWALWAVDQRTEKAERAIEAGKAGKTPDPADLLDTRYTVDGQPGEMEWLNNQLDGFGTLLWAIEEHLNLTAQPMPEDWKPGVSLLARYLHALWKQPCSDCWEEFADKIHIATLSAIYGGLNAASRMLNDRTYRDEATRIKTFVLHRGVKDGHLVKFIGTDWVDASLIHASTPYRLLEPDDPIMQATIAKLESDLIFNGDGLHRYVEDNYYGGGEWLLLTAYLAWHYVERGDLARANELRAWIEAQADELGNMPEQVPGHLLIPEMLPEWEAKWGRVASPLVWSHAAYLTLVDAMSKAH